MPSLVMRAPAEVSWNKPAADRAAPDQLRRRARRPVGHFGIRYNVRDLELTYQYSNFGVPASAEARLE